MTDFHSDSIGLPPAYLADGQMAYKATTVASWSAHNQARFSECLYTGEQLEQAVAAERERWAPLLRAAGRVLQAADDGYLLPASETLQGGLAVDELRGAWGAFAATHIREALKSAFSRGDLVRKRSGSAWVGRVVGEYSTRLTPEGYAVESAVHQGSVQIYPAAALELLLQRRGEPSPRLYAGD